MNTVLFFATTIETRLGGIARSVPALAQAVAEAGLSVTLVAPQCPEPTVSQEDIPNVCLMLPTTDRMLKSVLREQVQKVSNEQGIAYHAGVWSPWNHFFASLARKWNVPYIASPRSMLDPWALSYRGWKKKVAWKLYARRDLERASWIHATAAIEVENIAACGLRNRISIIPNGIEKPITLNLILKKSSQKRLLFLSRLHPKKGVEDLIDAFAETLHEGWELVIAGNDEDNYRSRLEKRVLKLVNKPNITFCGPVSDLEKWDLYRSADLFVLPSYSENFGIVVGEALSCGVPVITTQATPWAALPEKGCGWCVPTGKDALKAALTNILCNSREQLELMGHKGVNWIRSEYAWNRVGELMAQEFRKLDN